MTINSIQKNFSLLSLFVLVFVFSANAQYGNEWINSTQKYVKIKISTEGLYGIDYNQIIQSGIVTGTINPNKFQLFNKGKQVPLLISGDQINFGNTDKITFYGQPNDASLDKSLYNNPNDLPNSDVSLFEDVNYYFLTYSDSNGLRYQNKSISNVGLTPENYVIYNSRLNLSDTYYAGEALVDALSLSEFITGEGYMGPTFGKGQTVNYNLNTPFYATNTNLTPITSYYVAGRSFSASGTIKGTHHLKITVNNAVVADTFYTKYNVIRKQQIKSLGNLPTTSTIAFTAVNDLNTSDNFTDFQAPAYVDLAYPRLLNLSGTNNLRFRLNSQNNTYLKFTNSNLSNAVVLDNVTNTYYSEVKNNGNSEFVVNSTPNTKYFLGDLNATNITNLDPVIFKNFTPGDVKPYLLISNKNFTASTVDYKNYNETQNLPTIIAYTEDLYNEFFYGFHHPLAIRNFVSWGLDKGTTKPIYMLLLGNGAELSKYNLATDFVPSLGYPCSDNMLTSGLNGSLYEPGLITGRLPATNDIDVRNYLYKLKSYNNLPDSLWRKKILQISGGKYLQENESIANYQNQFYSFAKGEKFGASLSTIKKNINDIITENQTDRVIKETNQGIGLLSYFGHGATTGTEISFGDVTTYNNKNRTPIYLVNGCSTGDVFSSANSLAEQFILQKDYGGVAWMGTTSEGTENNLARATKLFYQNWFQDFYGLPIALGFQKGLKGSYLPNDQINLAHIRQYIFIGDPTLKFYSPSKPDYNVKDSYLSPSNTNQNSSLTSLSLKLKIENIGKAVPDSVSIKITRTLSDNSIIQIPIFKIKPVYNTDTISIILSNEGLVTSGNNKITAFIDPDNKVNELNENNNIATLNIFLPGNGINLLYPINKGIISKSTVSLQAEPDNLYTSNAEYLFELDTINTFNSSFIKRSGIIAAGLLPKWEPLITFENGKVYYWRAKLNLPDDKGGAWSTASFTYVPNVTDGVSISHRSQIENLTLNNVLFDSNLGNFTFSPKLFFTNIQTRGDDRTNADDKRIRANIEDAISFNNVEFTGITMVTYNNKVFNGIFSYPSTFNSTNGPFPINGYTGQFYWDINDPVQVDSMVSYINQIPKDFYVLGMNGRNIILNQLPVYAKNALKSIGLNKYDLVNAGEPYMFWGTKGSNPGSADEFTADYTSSTPARSQLIKFNKSYTYSVDNGSITSEKIGPAKNWNSGLFDYNKGNGETIKYSIIGVNSAGQESTLIPDFVSNQVDLSNINATNYPYLKIKTNIVNQKNQTIPTLKYWRFVYQPVTELTFNPEFKDIFKSLTVQEGDSTHWEIGISNLSDYPSDSMIVAPILYKADNSTVNKLKITIPKLLPHTNTTINIKDASLGQSGKNNLKLQFQTTNELDLYKFNNTISKDYTVNKDVKEPIVNVVFDGKQIINGEIVSPQPIINITTVDDNKFLLLSDTTLVDVYIKKQDDTKYYRLSYSSNQLIFKPATSNKSNKSVIQYIPSTPFDDGVYSLKVRSKDASGNYNTSSDYLIDFEVINKSEISNFYPYPNPFSTSMRFVFTLTGMKIPDDIKVVIMTTTGKIVREVFKSELGAIRIGNNISDFSWDGTDQFGDRLANGVYFYKVSLKNYDNAQIGNRKTGGDSMFKKNIGKIYLMR
jgi:hypothetical protein